MLKKIKKAVIHFWGIITRNDVLEKQKWPIFQNIKNMQKSQYRDFSVALRKKERALAHIVVDCANARLDKDHQATAFAARIITDIQNDGNNYRFSFLCAIESAFISLALIKQALAVRGAMEERLRAQYRKKGSVQKKHLVKLFWAFWAVRDEAGIEETARLLKKFIHYKNHAEMYRLLSFLGITKQAPTGLEKILSVPENQSFCELIRDKRVAIMGPAHNNVSDETLKKDYDIIIRLNYWPSEHDRILDMCGLVSYYNGGTAKALQGQNISFLDNLRYEVYKNIMLPYQMEEKRKGKARVIIPHGEISFWGSLNMVQEILFDLLYFTPFEIKVFSVNLFRAKSVYTQEYAARKTKRNPSEIYYSYAQHNLITQFEFTKLLYCKGCFLADDFTKETLDLTREEYIRDMDEIAQSQW